MKKLQDFRLSNLDFQALRLKRACSATTLLATWQATWWATSGASTKKKKNKLKKAMTKEITVERSTSVSLVSSNVTSASFTASPVCKKLKLRLAAALFGAWPLGLPRQAKTWCFRWISSCKKWWKTSTAKDVAPWWPLTHALAKSWPSSVSQRSTPICLSMALTARVGKN